MWLLAEKQNTGIADLLLAAGSLAGASAMAQETVADSVLNHASRGSRLSIGGYGEVAYSRNFYSDHVSRYSLADDHKDDPSHGRFDIPHAVIYLGYDFGKGWSLGNETEFEHGGVGMAYEKENEVGGEWEQEVLKLTDGLLTYANLRLFMIAKIFSGP